LPPQAASTSARAAAPRAIFTFICRYPKFQVWLEIAAGEAVDLKARPGPRPRIVQAFGHIARKCWPWRGPAGGV
jgi:hypothetical protein